MSGVLGCIGRALVDETALDAMMARALRFGGGLSQRETGSSDFLGVCGLSGTGGIFRRGELVAALHGHPFWEAGGQRLTGTAEVAERFLERFSQQGRESISSLHGDFALAVIDRARSELTLAVDRMSVHNIVYARTREGIVFGPGCDVVSRHPSVETQVDQQSLYNFIYFHMVPGPATVFVGQRRVPAGHFLGFRNGEVTIAPHWRANFVEDDRTDFATRKTQFRRALEDAVRTCATGARCGTFLSGGTDSSTIAGLLGIASQGPAQTFSIGFAAEDYDEMHYARIAAAHFRTNQHEYYVTPRDVVDAIPRIADAYDQPFGNASAVPTYYCARLARQQGMERILGGDGGDELYGGNDRYARQQQFAMYERINPALRRSLIEPFVRRLPSEGGITLLRKARSYVVQASMPMPERYESYNLLDRLGAENVFTPEFLAGIDRDAPMRLLREHYAGSNAKSLINKMLALDFQITLADSDLPKVTTMCELAGIDVAFPMLDDDVIDFSLRLPPDQKLRGTKLRYFFKEALRDFLPLDIINKQKHGFGLPTGTWLQSSPELRAFAADSVAALRRRHIIRPEFIDRLQDEHLSTHARYYGTMLWVLMMLELWFQFHSTG